MAFEQVGGQERLAVRLQQLIATPWPTTSPPDNCRHCLSPKPLQMAEVLHAFQHDWGIHLGKTPAVFGTVLVPGDNGEFKFQTEYRMLRNRSDDSFTMGRRRADDEEFHRWRDSFPLSVGHDHPNEVSAYLSGVLLERDLLHVEKQTLNRAHTKRINQTRRAFRQALRMAGE